MNRSRSIRWLPVVLFVLLFVAGCTTTTQQQEPTADPDPGGVAGTPENAAAPKPFDEIPRERANPAQERPYTYVPGKRRDPFLSPLDALERQRGQRQTGIAGMSVDDLDLTGIVDTPAGGGVAFVTGSDGRGYMLRVGDRIQLAHVLSIDAEGGSVTFRERLNDPRAIKPYRDRVLRLEPGG